MNPVWIVVVALVFIVGEVIKERIRADEVRLLVHALVSRNAGEVKILETAGPQQRGLRRVPETEGDFRDEPTRVMGL